MKNIDADQYVRGTARYVDDLPELQGTLHAHVIDALVAHGDIVRLNLDAVRSAPGVTAVFTAADIPGENQIGGIFPDEPLFAETQVDYAGQPIALVVADTRTHARAAAGLAHIDIDAKPVIVDPREAAKRNLFIHPPRTFRLGDVTSAWQACDHVFEGRVDSGGQEHLYIETQGAYAIPKEGRCLKIISSTQGLTAVQKTAARILGVPLHRIEVDVTRLGGGFGGKEDQASPWAALAALAAWHLDQPVKLILDRHDDMRMTGKRHPYSSDFKIGLTEDLKILAYEVTFFQNAGAAADLSPAILERSLLHATNTYFIPNVKIVAKSCRTNLPPNTAFRGFGGPQAMFVMESAICRAAEGLGVAAHRIQEANLLVEGDEFPYGQKAKRCHAKTCFRQAQHRFELAGNLDRIAQFNRSHALHKQGLAVMPICFGISFTKTHLNQASALVHIYQDGSVGVSTGAVEMGQGVNTKLAQIAAQAFSISPRRIRLETTNTTRTANTSPTAASTGSDLNGKALLDATRGIRDRLMRHASSMLGAPDDADVAFIEERICLNGEQTPLTWEGVVLDAYLHRVDLSQHGFFATPNVYFDTTREKGEPFAYHVTGTAVVRATVDCIRGTAIIDEVRAIHDFGSSLNPLVDLGQAEGAIVQGLGWMTMEEVIADEKGILQSNALSTYKVPDIYSAPEILDVQFLETEGEPNAVLRSKAVGEPPFMYGIGAFFAIRDAIRAFRPDADLPFDAPMTPEKILFALYGA